MAHDDEALTHDAWMNVGIVAVCGELGTILYGV